ncbi:Scr1 family TA system antitoxin-like transcriptional regulator [Kitasatospora sp. SUK 42]|uniref:Scr1 family TA system antitoxin-like transcriptional regulator n=1 Tax=Kitasatospora sp. SUK 42 TaxID=1588882 RepID=UPI0018CB0CF7|nr:Scr1 family TA system antitoxin-like transcriptional regulator [Kitasatospora sp. SUK 42]MBV2152743.1 DUF5753 domain-containing protein [Kitasatospora sp. SUK 42]
MPRLVPLQVAEQVEEVDQGADGSVPEVDQEPPVERGLAGGGGAPEESVGNAALLGSLIEGSERSTISIRVVLFDVDTLPVNHENFTYVEGPVPELDTAQMDSGLDSVLYDAPAHTAQFRSLLNRIDSAALSEEESREFIQSIKKDMESKNA